MYVDFTNSQKKTIQNTIGNDKIASYITLTSVWPRASNQDPKTLFFNPEKKWSIFSKTCGRSFVSIPPYSILCTLQNQNSEFQDNVHDN